MTPLAELQQALAAIILDRDPTVAGNHFTSPLLAVEDILTVHRNTYHETLSDALAANFPAIHTLIGTDCFKALAGRFVRAQPPTSPVLSEYGADFPKFLASQAMLTEFAYLGDVARLEWAWNQAFHAADQPALTPQELCHALEAGKTVEFLLHPSVRLLTSPHPVLAIWRLARSDNPNPAAPMAVESGEHLIVLRPASEVLMRELDAGAFTFLAALQASQPVEAALVAAIQTSPGFSPEGSLGSLVAMGAFTAPTI